LTEFNAASPVQSINQIGKCGDYNSIIATETP